MEAFEQDVTIDVKRSWSKEGLVSDYHAYWNVVKLYLCYYAPVKIGTYTEQKKKGILNLVSNYTFFI